MLAARDVVRKSGLGCLLLLAACTATATEVPPEAALQLNGLKNSLATGKAQIQRATEAARGLDRASSTTMEEQVARLLEEVASLESIALQGRQQYEAQTAEAKAYFVQWDVQLKTMTESVQKAGQERREESMKSFEMLADKVKTVRATFRPYMDALSEAARYLKTDKTAAGIKAIQPRVAEALKVETKLMKQIDDLNVQINTMLGT
jgi:Protein of unknown function (DUF2959)